MKAIALSYDEEVYTFIVMKIGLIMKKMMAVLSLLMFTGCSSYHNINEDGESSLGGGFKDRVIADGVYKITAKTNFAPWANFDAANDTFNRRAKELCAGNYNVIESSEDEFEHVETAGAAKYIISRVEGYVHCESSKLTGEEAQRKIELSVY